MSRNMIVASTSTLYGQRSLEYLLPELEQVFKDEKIPEILFIPFARPSGLTHDEYSLKVSKALHSLEVKVKGIHEYEDQQSAIESAQAIFTGGGNTFVLVKELHDRKLMQVLRKAVFDGVFYLGTSAGSNICGLSMKNTNDMPIVQPSSFKTMGLLGYNINAHYHDPIPEHEHMGETREQRIAEFHFYNSIPVVGLREGSFIRVKGQKEILKGEQTARIFRQGSHPEEMPPETDLSNLN